MTELAVIICRLGQYSAASVLIGSALFFVYALPAGGPGSAAALRWPKPLLAIATVLLVAATLAGMIAQAAVLAGSWADGLTSASLSALVTQMDLGTAALARAALAILALACIAFVRQGRALWLTVGFLGALACATFGWMGHGAATDGTGHSVHLLADIIHAVAAGLWVGALIAFVGLVAPRKQSLESLSATALALRRFSPVGIAVVGLLGLTGLVNTWYLVGPAIGAALRTPYGQLLVFKLILFAAMLALAALHRQRSVPALAATLSSHEPCLGHALVSLRRSLAAEAILGLAILAIVSWFGTLEPPGAM